MSSSSIKAASQTNWLLNVKIHTATGILEFPDFANTEDHKYIEITLPSKIQFRLICFTQDTFNRFQYKCATMYLQLSTCNRDKVTVRYRISILNADGLKCDTLDKMEIFYNNIGHGELYHKRWDYLTKPENGFLANGKLSIYCEIKQKQSNQTIDNNPVLSNYQSLLESGKFSDVTLVIGGKKLLAHKNILAAQSKVFEAMFENDCREKLQNRVEITDISVEVCEQMLRYIYTGQIPLDLSQFDADLFVAADKYQLDHLKTACEQNLAATLNIESAATTVLLADMHQATLLRSKCIIYITDNMTKVMDTEGWKVLTAARIELSLELLRELAIKTNR